MEIRPVTWVNDMYLDVENEELDEEPTHKKFLLVRLEGKRNVKRGQGTSLIDKKQIWYKMFS